MLQNIQQADKTLAATTENNLPKQPQMPHAQLNAYSSHTEKKSSLAEVLAQLSFTWLFNKYKWLAFQPKTQWALFS